jgi:hypothetical protein
MLLYLHDYKSSFCVDIVTSIQESSLEGTVRKPIIETDDTVVK